MDLRGLYSPYPPLMLMIGGVNWSWEDAKKARQRYI
jgi:hypothetical protein